MTGEAILAHNEAEALASFGQRRHADAARDGLDLNAQGVVSTTAAEVLDQEVARLIDLLG